MFKQWVLVAAGSALGGVARVALSAGIYRRWGTSFPWGTLAVNGAGCFFIGLLFTWAEERLRLGTAGRLFLMAGFCGGFTTFSTYALETVQLFKSGATFPALVYVVGSSALGLAAFIAGSFMGRLAIL
ncbi:MAG: fluoride efflux transporter CrcB [Elusimicrobia bacterium]|nr:fluoride efflux transporter CrcB [Elusimicrobiota bacterium]